MLPKLFSQNQPDFVKWRSIIKNVLLARNHTDVRKRGKPTNVVNNLDMTKAYDSVD